MRRVRGHPMSDPKIIPAGPNDYPWHEMHGEVQIRMAVFDRERGWLVTRRSIVRHGIIPTIERDEGLEESVVLEVKGGLRALKHAWKKR